MARPESMLAALNDHKLTLREDSNETHFFATCVLAR